MSVSFAQYCIYGIHPRGVLQWFVPFHVCVVFRFMNISHLFINSTIIDIFTVLFLAIFNSAK